MLKQADENKFLLLLVIKFLSEQKNVELRKLIDELQPYDLGKIYQGLSEKHRLKLLLLLTPKEIANLLQELDKELQINTLQQIGVTKSAKVLDIMENDDLAELLSGLSREEINKLLRLMKTEESQTVQKLLSYPPHTAGRIMTNRFVWIRNYYTVREAIDKLKSFAEYAENLYYLYVLDEDKKLVGVVSYRDLLLADTEEKIGNIMYDRVISVPVDMDQEEVARIFERYDFIAVPVVNKNQHILGIITVDDVLDVLIEEANEDIEKLSASGKSIDFNTAPLTAAMRRLPWLVLLLFIGVLSGSIISRFETTLQKVVSLAFFMPMIAGMTGNTGTQSLAVVIRGLASHDADLKTLYRLILRELAVSLIIGLICGLLISLIAYIWQGSIVLGLVVGSSLFITLIIGTMAGTVIPLILYRLKIDPAVASGPLITTLNDIFSLTVYFGLASLFITKLL